MQYPESFFAVEFDGVSIALQLGVITIVVLSDGRGVYVGLNQTTAIPDCLWSFNLTDTDYW